MSGLKPLGGRRGRTALLALALVVATPLTAGAQRTPEEIAAERDRTLAELTALGQQQELTEERVAELTAEITALGEDRATLNENLIATAERIRALEGDLDATEARLVELADEEVAVRVSLVEQREQLSAVLAALQRMGRNPAPALLVRAEDALSSVRSAMLLGAVVPDLRDEAETLASDLARLVALEADMSAERDQLLADATTLLEEQTRIEVLIRERQAAQNRSEEALAAERERAAELAGEAESLNDLVARMEAEITAAAEAAERARRAEASLAAALQAGPRSNAGTPSLGAADRIEPAIAFSRAQGLLPLPVNGPVVTPFAAEDGLGGRTEGLTLETRPGAQVSTPADGWVVYAGPFRSYGQLLILNTGGGYHIVLAGMERIIVELGQFVLAGEPVAVMGAQRLASVDALGIDAAQPLLYLEFRKDGQAIDPGPWWIEEPDAKVGG